MYACIYLSELQVYNSGHAMQCITGVSHIKASFVISILLGFSIYSEWRWSIANMQILLWCFLQVSWFTYLLCNIESQTFFSIYNIPNIQPSLKLNSVNYGMPTYLNNDDYQWQIPREKIQVYDNSSTVCSMKYLVYNTQTINFVFLYKHENDDDSILLP